MISSSLATKFEALLKQRRIYILAGIRAHRHPKGDGDETGFTSTSEMGDESVTDLLNDTDIVLLGNELTELQEIDNALLRLKAGTYGICTSCQNAIAQERLSAYPTAHRCLACQAEIEAGQRHGVLPGSSI